MINLLPAEIKNQLRYGARNTTLRRYIGIGLIMGGLLGLLLIGSLWYANRQIANLNASLAERQQTVDSYKTTQDNVQALENNLNLYAKLVDQKTFYSKLLSDIATLLPKGAYINHLELTGSDSQPMEIDLTAKSFTQAAQVRNALATSNRFASADIQTITKNGGSGYAVVIVVGFKPGEAR